MFCAVENEQLERTRMIIESTDVDINRYFMNDDNNWLTFRQMIPIIFLTIAVIPMDSVLWISL